MDIHANSFPRLGTRVGGVDGTPPRRCRYVAVFQNDFTLIGKPLIYSTRMRYILWVVALPEAYDITNNGHHLGCHLGLYQELKVKLKL